MTTTRSRRSERAPMPGSPDVGPPASTRGAPSPHTKLYRAVDDVLARLQSQRVWIGLHRELGLHWIGGDSYTAAQVIGQLVAALKHAEEQGRELRGAVGRAERRLARLGKTKKREVRDAGSG